MQTTLSHVQVNIAADNLPFYREFTELIGWKPIAEGDAMLGVLAQGGPSVWFIGASNGANNDYDGPGMNHLGFGAASQADVDAVVAWLAERNIECLFETPRHRPDFSAGEGQTYYQVMFATPDNILFEVVYTGPKQDYLQPQALRTSLIWWGARSSHGDERPLRCAWGTVRIPIMATRHHGRDRP